MDNDEATPTNAGIANAANQPCVLLVEDDRSARRFLEVTLQRCGYKVIAAADGPIAAIGMPHSVCQRCQCSRLNFLA